MNPEEKNENEKNVFITTLQSNMKTAFIEMLFLVHTTVQNRIMGS